MPEYLRMHIDALLRLSHAARDRAVSIELGEMADECRIMLSVANINEMTSELKQQASNRRRSNASQSFEQIVGARIEELTEPTMINHSSGCVG